jgi:virginiamycin B lyase
MKKLGTYCGGSAALLLLAVLPSFAASIAGNVKGPDGKPLMGIFVVAENSQNKMTVTVLSDARGNYHINNLPAATYSVQISAVGYKSDPHDRVQLASDQKFSCDFALQTAPVRWTDLTTYQITQLLPKTDKHDLSKRYQEPYFNTCMTSCHSLQHRVAPLSHDKDGWKVLIQYMSNTIMGGEGGGRMTDERADDFAEFLAAMFGPDSKKPDSPADLPDYKKLTRTFSPEAMNIAYVEYDFPPIKGQGPWSAVEDKDGMFWIPYYGRGNEVVRLNSKTAELTRFPLPFTKTAGIHSAVPAPDGTVWFTEAALGKFGHLNPATKEIVEYQNTPLPDGKPTGTHTIRVDEHGRVWTSGGPAITMFDPATKQFSHFDLGNTYANVVGHDGDEWFTSFVFPGPIGRVTKDGKLSKFYPPTKGKPQRLLVDENNIVWFSERGGNKLGRFDPKTEAFKEYDLPGPAASPYAIGMDRNKMIWYASHEQDTIGRFDPETGDVVEYPYPHSEISMREFFMDSQGRMWYASSVNNKVGYWYINQ